MAEAKIQLPGGAMVDVTGTPEEVAKVLAMLKAGGEGVATKAERSKADVKLSRNSKASTRGPKAFILELKSEGFFKGHKRTLRDVQQGLEARGRIYPATTLSGAVLDLVKARELGRVKDDGHWAYVHRD